MNFSSPDISIYSGVLLFIFYFIMKIIKKQTTSLTLSEAIIIIIAGTSVVAGIKVCLLSFDKDLCKTTEIEQIYVFLGGFSVIWTSGMEIYSRIFKQQQVNATDNQL
jgi:hypothetical protein